MSSNASHPAWLASYFSLVISVVKLTLNLGEAASCNYSSSSKWSLVICQIPNHPTSIVPAMIISVTSTL